MQEPGSTEAASAAVLAAADFFDATDFADFAADLAAGLGLAGALLLGQTRKVPSLVVFSSRYGLPQSGQVSATGLVAAVKPHLG